MNAELSTARGRGTISKGLVTIALLKSNFDEKRDHIEMFQPFLLDAISARASDDFSLEEIKKEFEERHGLVIPADTMKILLSRACNRKVIKREAGRYFRDKNALGGTDITEARKRVEKEHIFLAAEFRKFASLKDLAIPTDEEGIVMILDFIAENQTAFLLNDPSSAQFSPSRNLPHRDAKIVATFITEVGLKNPQLAEYLQRMLEGLVLQNTLLLKDISAAARKFQDLTVFLDTAFMFRALGLHGQVNTVAARESLELLRTTNARLAIFDKTVEEMRSILRGCERALGVPDRTKLYWHYDLTKYLFQKHYSPSDVRTVIALLDRNIRDLGISIIEIPLHDRDFTLGEKDLASRLAGEKDPDEPRVVHDVDCVAAILTIRRGYSPQSLDNAKAVFATTSGSVVRKVDAWFRASRETGASPIIYQIALSNIAWLKKPASAGKLKLHELVALCAAAIRPSEKTWTAFLNHLRKSQNEGSLKSDEAVAIVANELTETFLGELDEETDLDSNSLSEIVDRVKADYRKEADAAVGKAQAVVAEAQGKVVEAHARAGEQEEKRRELELRVEGRVNVLALVVSKAAFYLAAIVVSIGLIFSLPGVFRPLGKTGSFLAWASIIVFSIFSFYHVLRGIHLEHWRLTLEGIVRTKLRNWIIGAKDTK